MTTFLTMTDHDNALMLCAHWATPASEKGALSSVASRISMNEQPDAEDLAIFRARLAEWEGNAITTFYVADDQRRQIGADFATEAEARENQKATCGALLMWKKSYPQPVA